MKVVLLLLPIVSGGLALWAIGMLFLKKKLLRGPPEKEPWENSLDQLMFLSDKSPEPHVIACATHAIALCLKALSRRIEDFNRSTETLGKINLLLAAIIAVATIAYALAAWLQVK